MTTRPTLLRLEFKLPAALLCLCALSTAGCFTKKPPAAHLAAIHLGAPVIPAVNTERLTADPPDIPIEPSEFPRLVSARNAPPRPRVAPTPTPEPAHADKAKEPIIAPEVTNEEMVAARNESQQSLDIADHNLSLAAGKSLNATQEDLVSKVRGFSDSAREAMRLGDWARAKTLAKKAEVLSVQLVSSL